MRRFISAAIAFTFLAGSVRGAGFAEEFAAVKEKKDDEATQKFLKDAYDAHKEDPEYFVLAANYFWNLSQEVSITTKPAAPGDFSVRDQKTGKEVGSISTAGSTNPAVAEKALSLLTEAAGKFPLRADIPMGLAYLQHKLGKEDECAASLNTLLDRCADKTLQLTWKASGPMPEPAAEFIPRSMQKYASDFYREETKEGDARCRKLCERLIEVFPEHPFAYNNLAGLSRANGDDAACLNYLQLANQKAPQDMLVLLNLGDAYVRAGDKPKARACFEKAAKDADPETRAQAAKALKALGSPRPKKEVE